ncbi:MAG: nucleotide sugar dehydrogenase [Solirubrobacteraceae bacterium]
MSATINPDHRADPAALATAARRLAAAAGSPSGPIAALPTVAVVGLGYVGLPSALALQAADFPVIGLDISERRLTAIAGATVDLLARDRALLIDALDSGRLNLSSDMSRIEAADIVLIAVPTPVDADLNPDPGAVHAACAAVVEHARAGQTIILTSTTYVGTTRTRLVEPLAARGLIAGRDVHVAFAPERILPGDESVSQTETPRVLGGVTPACTQAARSVLEPIVKTLHTVSSAEAAEATKLLENTFRALNLAFANEMAGVAKHYGLDIIELMDAAATKPYGFLVHYPGAGIGGHCIPVDPYYLLAPLADTGVATPIATTAMRRVAERPADVASRALEVLSERGLAPEDARVLVVGMAYKPGVQDYRESPACAITQHLAATGVRVDYYDPLVESAEIPGAGALSSVAGPVAADYDLALVATVHPGFDYGFLADCAAVLDATYRTPGGRQRHTV